MPIETTSAEAAYLTKGNIVRPSYVAPAVAAAEHAAAEAKGRADIAALYNYEQPVKSATVPAVFSGLRIDK